MINAAGEIVRGNGPCDERKRPVIDNIKELEQAIGALGARARDLGNLLEPIMTPCPPPVADERVDKVMAPPNSSIANDVLRAQIQVREIIAIIEEYIHRIEI
jgi:hypothetical protein